MTWRNGPRNPLIALRRVVDEVPDELAPRRAAAAGTVRVTAVARGATALAVRPSDEPEPEPEPSAPPAPAPDPAAREPSSRPVRAVITSTPAGPDTPDLPIVPAAAARATPTAAGRRDRPARRVPPIASAPRREPAGAWSTSDEAPQSTPTWLRASPRTATGGATASATGTWASLAPDLEQVGPSDTPAGFRRLGAPRLLRRLPPGPPHRRPAPLGPAGQPRPRSPQPPPRPVRPADRRLDLATGRRPMSVRQVAAAMLVCLAVWGLVYSPALYHNAQVGTIGTRRRVALDLLRPVTRVSAALGLDRIVHVSDRAIGRHQHTPTPLLPPPPAAAAPGGGTRPIIPVPARTLPAVPVPTAAAPLRVLVVGDSIGLSFGQSLGDKLDATGVVRTTVDAREGTGLARPDSFDWLAQLRADIVQFHPQVIVAMFGGNDDQDVQVNGRYIGFGSPQWQQIYAARVAQFAAEATTAHADLLWSGLPVMRSAARTSRYATVMAAARAGLGGQVGTAFIDNATTLSGSSGQYVDALRDGSGQLVIVREPDGVHLSPAGAGLLATKAITALGAQFHIQLP